MAEIKSWQTPSNATTKDGNSYAGAYWSIVWTESYVSPGVTRVTFDIWKKGRTVSPTWLDTECEITITDHNGTVLYALDTGRMSSSSVYDADGQPVISFRNTRYKIGETFNVTHKNDGTASFNVAWRVMIYSGVYHSSTNNGNALSSNVPYYTLTFNDNGGSGGPGSQSLTPGVSTQISSTQPRRSGYTFAWWSTQNSSTSGTRYSPGAYITISEPTTLYAIWSANYTVTYNGNGATGGSVSNTSHTALIESALSSSTFVRGYAVRLNGNNGTVTGSATLGATYAQDGWSYNGTNYSLGQSVSGLTSTANSTITMNAHWSGGSVTLPNATRDGYRFAGWNTNSSGTGTRYTAGSPFTPTADTTLYAQWTPIAGQNANIIFIKVNNKWKISNRG